MSPAAHTTHKAMDFAEALVGHHQETDGKISERGKTGIMVFYNTGLLQLVLLFPSPLEMLTGRRPCSSLPQLPSSIGHNMETSRICHELLRRQPTTSTGAMELEPGQPVFVKEVNGNVWRAATVD